MFIVFKNFLTPTILWVFLFVLSLHYEQNRTNRRINKGLQ